MRLAGAILVTMTVAEGAVVSHAWRDGKLTLKLEDGAATMEWLSPVAFRLARSWRGEGDVLPRIRHERTVPELEDSGATFTMRTRYLTVDLDRADLNLRVTAADTPVVKVGLLLTAGGVELGLRMAQDEKVFGLMGSDSGRLNLRGERLERRHGLFFTSRGYGIFMRAPERCAFDLASGTVQARGSQTIEYVFYYGPTPKEILEQHQTVAGESEVTAEALELLSPDRLPPTATPLPKMRLDSWQALGDLVRKLNQWSLSAVQYPALDLASLDWAKGEVKQRAEDMSTLLPIVYRSSGEGGIEAATRYMWKPYLITYLREGYDRGYPLIRPLPMQFSRDSNSDRQADVFMLGDEILLAPVLAAGGRRRLDLPRGIWTDLRTNAEYRGNRTVEVEAPAGRVPMFARNGSIVPLMAKNAMELHYFPSLAGEFFLWEPDPGENSQFHASPAGEFMRLETETQVRRTYEWVIHHTKAAHEVAGEGTPYKRVDGRTQLRPGTWWHDAALNNLHVMERADAGADKIVNISF